MRHPAAAGADAAQSARNWRPIWARNRGWRRMIPSPRSSLVAAVWRSIELGSFLTIVLSGRMEGACHAI
jgi:hypothetical protein